MKSVIQLLKMDHKHMEHELCHPRRQAGFDNQAIQKKIEEIRNKKQQLRVQAERKRNQSKVKQLRFQDFPLEQILEESLQPLDETMSMVIKQKIKFTQDKVYIGTKNNINNEYISKVIDSSEAKPALKYELSLFMQEMVSNLQTDIVSGEYDIFSKKDIIIPKHDLNPGSSFQPGAAKLIQIKKVQLSQKIDQLRDQLTKTQIQQEKLSPIPSNGKSFTIRSASANNSMITQSLNIDDYSIKSQRTKEAETFIKKLQKQQFQQRIERRKRQEELKKLQAKSEQQKIQFEQQLKNEKHQQLKKKFQKDRQQKMSEFQKISRSKAEYEKFLSEYRKRIPLFKQKDLKYNQKKSKEQKQKMMAVFTEIKQAKRSIDINQLKEHEKKYQVIRKQFQSQKIANLKHRQKEIQLRQKQDKLYFRGRYHSMIKEEIQKQPEDPALKRDELLKKKKQFADKVKKQFVPVTDESKQKELQELIQKINRNKPTVQEKDYNELGNNYLRQLHVLVKEMRQKGKVKVDLPQDIKPRYKNYLNDLKRSRNYSTVTYDKKDPQSMQKMAQKLQKNARKKQKILSLAQQIDIEKQLKQIDELDMELLKSAQIKAKLLNKYDPLSQNESDN